jgi:hypothetical protein
MMVWKIIEQTENIRLRISIYRRISGPESALRAQSQGNYDALAAERK